MTHLLYVLGLFVVLLLPLIEVIAFTFYWRGTIEHKWLFAFLGILAVYIVGALVLWLVDRYGPMHVHGVVIVKAEPGAQAQSGWSEVLEPHMMQFFAILIAILLAGAAVLWGIKKLMTKA